MTLDEYKEAVAFLNEHYSDNMSTIAYDDYDGEIFLQDGTTNLAEGWDYEINRSDENMTQQWYWKADKADEYAIYVEGWYDSWAGSSIESDEFKVGKVSEMIVKYVQIIEVE